MTENLKSIKAVGGAWELKSKWSTAFWVRFTCARNFIPVGESRGCILGGFSAQCGHACCEKFHHISILSKVSWLFEHVYKDRKKERKIPCLWLYDIAFLQISESYTLDPWQFYKMSENTRTWAPKPTFNQFIGDITQVLYFMLLSTFPTTSIEDLRITFFDDSLLFGF